MSLAQCCRQQMIPFVTVWIVGIEVQILSCEYSYTAVLNTYSMQVISISKIYVLVLLLLCPTENCMEDHSSGQCELNICIFSWWGQSKVLSVYLSYIPGSSCEISEDISSKNSIYIFAITWDNGDPIAKPSSCWYMLEYNWIYFVLHRTSISLAWALEIKAVISVGAMMCNYGTCLMVTVNIRHLLITASSEVFVIADITNYFNRLIALLSYSMIFQLVSELHFYSTVILNCNTAAH